MAWERLKRRLLQALDDLYATGCRIVTIGQYLAPSLEHIPVVEYVTPEKFEEYRKKGLEIGFEFVESSPLVRSSFHAEKHMQGSKGEMDNDTSRYDRPASSPEQRLRRVIFDDLGFKRLQGDLGLPGAVLQCQGGEKRRTGSPDGNKTPDRLIFVEHNHVYTLGKSGSEQNLLLDYIQLQARDASFYRIDRGGDITYHGPGQLVGYPIFDLEGMGIGLREYITPA
ncbi:MAG: hypothetical protein MZV63_51930 [Marinilabiliales bacterium]|nr:hypothetical protein [Marinilabiliales bacterium]